MFKQFKYKSAFIFSVIIFLNSFIIIPANATPTISIGTSTFGAGVATNVGVSLTGFDETQSYQVTVKFVNSSTNVDVTNGTLAATQGSTTLITGYASYSAAKLGFKGTYSAIATALSTLTWNPSSASGDISIRIGISTVPGSNEFYDANSGHYYRYVSTGTSWNAARTAAESTTLNGLKGYLAIITSTAENDFIKNETTAQNIWIGATEDATTTANWTGSSYNGSAGQYWIWDGATGADKPAEAGTFAGNTATFQSWASGEPNNDSKPGQDCAVTNWGGLNGRWNDLTCSYSTGYLIEFGGRSGETSTAISSTKTQTVTAREAVTLGTFQGNISCTFGSCSSTYSLTDPTATNSSSATVSGTFSYSSSDTSVGTVSVVAGGAILTSGNAGNSTITVTFTPTDTSLYASATKTFTLAITGTAPAAPTGLVATSGNSLANLSWSAGSTGGAAITDYLVEYSTDNASWTTFSDGTSTSTSATVTGLTNGTLYYFRVSAINSINTGSATAAVTTTPAAPSSGGSSSASTPTATPTPTSTPIANPTRASTPRPTPIPTSTQNLIIQNPLLQNPIPQSGSINNPAPLIKKIIEEIIEPLRPKLINLFNPTNGQTSVPSTAENTQIPNTSGFNNQQALELSTETQDKKVVELPSLVLVNDLPEPSKVVIVDNTTAQIVTPNGGLLNVVAKEGESSIPVDNRGRVQMVRNNNVEAEGKGLAPNSEFAVYLFSEPTLIGVGKTDSSGQFFASFPVEDDLPIGDHTLQVNGILPDGKTSSISMPVVLVDSIITAQNQAMPKTILVDDNPIETATNSLYFIIVIFIALIVFMLFGGYKLLFAAFKRND